MPGSFLSLELSPKFISYPVAVESSDRGENAAINSLLRPGILGKNAKILLAASLEIRFHKGEYGYVN